MHACVVGEVEEEGKKESEVGCPSSMELEEVGLHLNPLRS